MNQKPDVFDKPIYVTKPMLPPLDEYSAQLADIWGSAWLTNGGQKHAALEAALADRLGAPHFSLFNNGTSALLVACQALRLAGEVITTPFTFPATPHVLHWNNVTPVFCDIDEETLTLDPVAAEALITSRTTGVLGVHVYGMPCDVAAFDRIRENYGIKVLYDAAHAFGTEIDGVPISRFGDATMFSFHATKLFNSAEGGGLALADVALKKRVDLLKNFGILNETDVIMPGINGKMNEIQAALGLVNLSHYNAEHDARQRVAQVYLDRLEEIPGVRCFRLPVGVSHSMQYFIIRVNAQICGVTRDRLYERLKQFNVFARRYFYPLCSEHNCYRALPSADPGRLPVATRVSRDVLALPLFGELGEAGAHRIVDIVKYICNGK
ncbi:DegT/DnrJ/EryC1/StrS family aminotransferase [Burkholderia cenocepacia]|uniref:DegT/DnrJ/EryC1/StrS family aminotransferase n=1 Tax=Burkholderia cenocepacia TaxID=95486 RepID=UPI0007535DD4|nr:DegT/DnrJ/EryC1/StrS family aminotransferase [Burkholderia cenocepacia]AOK33507.1 aminotransferase [Burkholderia cenocepacia]ARF86334.1 DegT/DnrJ/EryC1/StrS aminotransferase [Burkholderia cenocepacia]ARF88917.1 DegT/DnrJ/EryC1/StrS aminotransferase [Burkholderia cenocepacia]KWF73175.1 aminotransferase [Burkholderia cenocepacia]MBR7939096.1 DegT/DnrJ/EryC1/StrS family aminotransferase [Burkholderia cenocepacia]